MPLKHLMPIFRFCQHSENQRPKLWGIGNLKSFYTMNIYEMAAIFWFFHNGWCWYSVSIVTQKIRDKNFNKLSVGAPPEDRWPLPQEILD